jgi:hypothetical protein
MQTATGAHAPCPEALRALFLASILPSVRSHARAHVRHLPPSDRDDAMAECIALAWKYTTAIAKGEKSPADHAGPLAYWAVKKARAGRKVWSAAKPRSVRAMGAGGETGTAIMAALTDERDRPDELVPFKLDASAWLASLSERSCELVNGFTAGNSGKEMAAALGLSQGRICQLRKELAADYAEFVGLPAIA